MGSSFALEPLQSLPFWLKQPKKKIIVGSHLTLFVPRTVEATPNFHHTQHFSARQLTSYEVLFLAAPQ